MKLRKEVCYIKKELSSSETYKKKLENDLKKQKKTIKEILLNFNLYITDKNETVKAIS